MKIQAINVERKRNTFKSFKYHPSICLPLKQSFMMIIMVSNRNSIAGNCAELQATILVLHGIVQNCM